MLSPESADFIPTGQDDPDKDEIQEISDTTNTDAGSNRLVPEVPEGFDNINKRIRLSNLSTLSRYKVGLYTASLYGIWLSPIRSSVPSLIYGLEAYPLR